MVLTQLPGLWYILSFCISVSIPLWFSRNLILLILSQLRLLGFHTTMVLTQLGKLSATPSIHSFPYHYGSYATCLSEIWRKHSALGFHTTMVLTQPNPILLDIDVLDRSFHTTMVLTQQIPASAPTKSIQVSIPLWFLRNQSYKM